MTGDIALLGLLGAGVGLGLALLVAGWRGRPVGWPARRLEAGQRAVAAFDRRRVRLTAAAVAVGVLVVVVTGWVAGAVLAAAGVLTVPALVGPDRQAAARVARVEAVASWTEMLRDTLSAAAGLEQTVLATASTAPAALQAEVSGLAARLQRGDRLPVTLRRFADEVADPTADLVVCALVLAAEHQARQLADLLGELAREAREQVAMRLRVDASRARIRTSVRVIVGTTVAFAVGLVMFNRPFLHPYDTASGQLALLAVGGLFAVAFRWLARIAHVQTGERVLTNPARTGEGVRV